MEEANQNILFMQLVIQNQQIAMMAMGKVKNPVSDKIERNLEHAKIYIDTLDMLAAKTKGNLSEYEEKFLTETIKELKLNYVDEIDKEKKNGDAKNENNKEDSAEEKKDENSEEKK
jgi:type III secretory pathway component EscR